MQGYNDIKNIKKRLEEILEYFQLHENAFNLLSIKSFISI